MIGFSARQVVAVVLVLLSTTASMDAEHGKYQVGQVWAYIARPGEEESTATILKIEKLEKLGDVIHVSLTGLRIRNCSGGRGPTFVAHLPILRSALERSTTKRLKSNVPLPYFADGYKQWQENRGGVYTITLREIVQLIEDTFNQGIQCSG